MEFEVFEKVRGFKFGTYTFKLINEATGTKTIADVFEKFKENDEGFTIAFYFCCAKHWAMSRKEEVDFNEVDVADWLDELGKDKLREITTELFKVYLAKNQTAPTTGQEVPQ